MHVDVSYAHLTGEEKDAKAIQDIKEYLSEEQWDTVMQIAGAVEYQAPEYTFQGLNIALSFTGVSGFPVHAFGRKYCPTAYAAWMAEPETGIKWIDGGKK